MPGPLAPSFALLTCETDESLREGTLTSARQVRFEAGRMGEGGKIHVQLQCGLMGTIEEGMISDKWMRAPALNEPSTDAHGLQTLRQVPNTGTADGQTFSVVVLSVDRDALSGWGAVVHVITPQGITSKQLKGRLD